jgi:archaeoflavoprotein AfpA
MSSPSDKIKKRRVAWGITGAGDKITEYIEIMKEMKAKYDEKVEIQVFISKAGETVLRFYNLENDVKQTFAKVTTEINSNAPFLAAWLQTRKYEFLLVAPASSNTVAKIACGIGDTMLTNAANMSLKAFVPVYVVPVDFETKTISTKLPNGKEMRLRIRNEDSENVRRLERMEDMHVLSNPEKIRDVFKEWFDNLPKEIQR